MNSAGEKGKNQDVSDFYGREDVQQWIRGEITLQELTRSSPEQMLKIAETGYNLYVYGRYNEAQIVFEGLTSLNPLEAYYFAGLGAVYLAQENLTMAEKVLSRAIELDNMEQSAFINRGEVYLRQGRLDLAVLDFGKAVDLDPESKQALTARAHVLGRTTADAIKFIQDNREELEAELKQLQAEEAKKKQQGASQSAKK